MPTRKKKHKLMYWMDTGIFPATVMFIVGYTYDEAITEMNKKKAGSWAMGISEDRKLWENSYALAMSRELENKKTGEFVKHFYIKLRDQFTFTDREYCVLAHEVLHICQFMLPDILDRDKENEAECYLHSYLMEECLKRLREKS